MFRAVPLPIIRSSFTVHLALVCHTSMKTAFGQRRPAVFSASLGFAVKKLVTMHGDMNVKLVLNCNTNLLLLALKVVLPSRCVFVTISVTTRALQLGTVRSLQTKLDSFSEHCSEHATRFTSKEA